VSKLPSLDRFIPLRAGFAPDLSFPFPAFILLSSNQQACSRLSPFIHHVFGVWSRLFGLRSIHCLPLSLVMLLSTGFAGVSGVCRWSPPSPLSLGRWCVLPTHQIALRFNWRVRLPTAPSSTFRANPWWFQSIPPFPTAKRPSLGGAWFSRASREGSHPASANLVAAIFVFVCLLYWIFLLYSSPPVYPCVGVWVLVTQYTCQIIFIGGPAFVASVPRVKGPASLEALLSRTFVYSLNFGLPRPCCIFAFFFLIVIVLLYLYIKKKKLYRM
jgi:hypothetical protein